MAAWIRREGIAAARRRPLWSVAFPRVLSWGLATAVLGTVIAASWVGDDAFITMRTVEAALRGDGPVWNPGERVQAFTHPLWLLCLLFVRAVVPDPYLALLICGWVVTALALVVFLRARGDPWRVAAALLLALGSKSFIHFGTSGLENPLAYLCVVLTMWEAGVSLDGRTRRSRGRLAWLVVVAGLTRPDLVLLTGIPAGLAYLRAGPRTLGALLRPAMPALTAAVAWEAFSLVYFGVLLPNTAYAKLGTGIPRIELLEQGWRYLIEVARWDPLTMAVVLFVPVAAVWSRARGPIAWSVAVWAYLAYVCWIGGGFMLGRFFAVPFFASVCVLGQRALPPGRGGMALAGALAVGLGVLAAPRTPWSLPRVEDEGLRYGIADEQAFYFTATGLLAPGEGLRPRHPLAARGRQLAEGEVLEAATVGFLGHAAGDRAVIIDPLALTDPFLARLPAARDQTWRVGHQRRPVPEGYVQSVREGACRMNDRALCRLFDDVSRVTRGPLFSAERWAAIWRLNRGISGHGVDRERLRRVDLVTVQELPRAALEFRDGGLRIRRSGGADESFELELSAGSNYEVVLRGGGQQVCRREFRFEALRAAFGRVQIAGCGRWDDAWVSPTSRPRGLYPYRARPLGIAPGQSAGHPRGP